MANFAGGGFSQGYSSTKAVMNQADQIRAARQQQIQDRLAKSLENSEKVSLDTYKQYVDLIGKAVQQGAGEEQIRQLAETAIKPLQSHANVLAQLRAQATSAGATPEMLELMPDPQRFIGDNIGVLQFTVNNALGQTPEAEAARAAEAKMAEAKAVADQLGQPIERVAQAMGLIPAPPQPFEALDAEGKPAFVERGPNGLQAVPGATPIPKRGMTIETTPDGGVRVTMGGDEEERDMERPTLARIEKSIVDSQEGLARLTEIQRSFQPGFLTYVGRFENWRLDVQSRINPDSLSAEDKKFLADYTDFTTNAIDNMNRYIRDMTGAQLSEFESDRLRKGIPDPERDGPNVFKAKMDASVRQLTLARARAVYTRNQGLDKLPFDALSLDEMDAIINRRADELTAVFARQNIPGPEARSRALAQVQQEFGL